MKSSFAFAFAAGLTVSFGLAAMPGCSSTTNVVGGTSGSSGALTCDSSQCLPGNTCLTVGEETKCRKTCTGNNDGSCPFGYTCAGAQAASCTKVANADPSICGAAFKGNVFECANPPLGCRDAGNGKWCCPESVCLKQTNDVKKSDKGQFGARCNASKGRENPDCDGAQGFFCFGLSPADGDAYCTRYDCASDLDCGPTFYCGDANVGPNASSTTRTIRETQKVCLRRDYCSPCTSDVDCRPTSAGVKTHCVPDDNFVGFCAPECTENKNCAYDAKCVDGGIGVKTCYPRAGKCVGDGSICSPCRSDVDCGDDGVCVQGQYTTEKSCAKKSKIPCKEGAKQGTDFDCPLATGGVSKTPIRCLGSALEQAPRDYCHGLYLFDQLNPRGPSPDIGCWTPNRD
ncbi:MAG: hypothetical protein JST00_14050 [Deltaproteobacteria bacterium]|nr:hypothetical protein [Deltaproteobacteria bacterium]